MKIVSATDPSKEACARSCKWNLVRCVLSLSLFLLLLFSVGIVPPKQFSGFMRNNECERNKFNYTTLMNGFCKEGKLEEAMKVFDEMQRSGLEKDAVSYTTLVGYLCRNGKVNKGIELVKEMNQSDCIADVITYNLAIEGLCKEGRVLEGMRLLESLSYDGVKLNVASYRIVMNCLCVNGDMERAVGLLGLMLGRGFVPHVASSNQLLIGFVPIEHCRTSWYRTSTILDLHTSISTSCLCFNNVGDWSRCYPRKGGF